MRTGPVPLIVAIALGVLALFGLVTATSPWIRSGSISLIVMAVAVVAFRWVKRRPKNTSLDDAFAALVSAAPPEVGFGAVQQAEDKFAPTPGDAPTR